jgi:precorrin-6B methylase 1
VTRNKGRRVGSLVVAGTGIRPGPQTTPEARTAIEDADTVLFLLDPVGARWIATLNASVRSLGRHYSAERPRTETYRAMVEEILTALREGLDVCVALYGHPGVFVDPSHEAIRRARAEGFEARMIPGISAEDCLVADLGVDPGDGGWHAYEATQFLLHDRVADPSVQLVLWQIGAVGERRARKGPNRAALAMLVERLIERYGPDHEAILYQASPYAIGGAVIERLRLSALPSADVPPLATLYVPPAVKPALDRGMADALGAPEGHVIKTE